MDPKRIQIDLARIERRLTKLDAQRASTRDVEAEALGILRRWSNEEKHMKPDDNQNPIQPDRSNFFKGANGQVREIRPDGSITGVGRKPGTFTVMPDRGQFWQDQAASVPGAAQRMTAGAPAAVRTFNPAPAMEMTRTAPNPAGQAAAILDPRSMASEMLRRANNAMSSARVRSTAANTRSAMQRHYDAAGAERDFWLSQAASIGPNAQARYLQGQELRSQEGQTNANNATAIQRTFDSNQTRLDATQMQQDGAAQRGAADNAARLRETRMKQNAPQQFTREDGSVGVIANRTFYPVTDQGGNTIFGQQPKEPGISQSALARLTGDLARQFSGIDEYGQVPDESAPNGYRLATSEERESAFRNASRLARETLTGQSATPASEPRQSASSAPARGRPASLEAFLERARKANPGYSDAELTEYFNTTYQTR